MLQCDAQHNNSHPPIGYHVLGSSNDNDESIYITRHERFLALTDLNRSICNGSHTHFVSIMANARDHVRWHKKPDYLHSRYTANEVSDDAESFS